MQNEELLKKLIEVVQLFEQFNKNNFEDIYNGLNINEVHSIEFIGKNKNPNVTGISTNLNITRGGATKITKKLINKEYIFEYKLEDNKKEKYFKLTRKGKEILKKHEDIHINSIKRDSALFELFTDEERYIILRFLDILKDDLICKLK